MSISEQVNEGLTLKDRKKFTAFINVERSAGSHENMTLNEAIEHLNDILQPERKWDCEECRNEHIQLREWLLELQERRERSAVDCGGWTPCKKRLPDVEASENVKSGICTDNGKRFLITDTEGYVYESTFWLSTQEFKDDAIAWMPKPEPYHEP